MTPTFVTVFVIVLTFTLAAPAPALADRRVHTELHPYEEVPSVSSTARGEFRARISRDGTEIHYTLSYSGLEGDVRQAHIHFGQHGVNGGIVVFLCQTTTNPDPTGHAPTCPQSGTVSDTLTAANMTGGAAGQGIAPGEFSELVAAIRAGVAYVNVHSSKFTGGELRGQLGDHD